ncbi:MAG: hypothetical protein ABSB73_12905 [Solirubrobacteraceae bacterium]|jgi:hypothetical protein
MSAGSEESNISAGGGEPSEAELRAAWEEQLRLLTPADVIVQTAVSLISLAGRRLGLEPGTEGERDLGQVRDAIDGARALLPVLERGEAGPTLAPLREAISALQFEYAKLAWVAGAATTTAAPGAGGDAADAPPAPAPARGPGETGTPDAGPAQRSGRLWVPGS